MSGKYNEIFKASSIDLYQSPDNFLEIVHPKDYDRVKSKYEELLEGRNVVVGAFRVKTKAGTFWVKISTYGTKYKWKKFTQVVGVIERIEVRHSVNSKLRDLIQVRKNILNILTWDFKMPLNSILSLSELIEKENVELQNKELSEYIDLLKKISMVLNDTLSSMSIFVQSAVVGEHPRKKLPSPARFRRSME